MDRLYLLLNLGSLALPFAFSFHKKIQFHKEWRYVLPGILLTLLLFVLWDIWYTSMGVWNFNPEYLVGLSYWGLPIEEILFFLCIPYACLFTDHVFKRNVKSWRLGSQWTKGVTYCLLGIHVLALVVFYERAYTAGNSLYFVVLVSLVVFFRPHVLSRFYLTYLVILLPFFIVNGVLTGSWIEGEVVGYNNAENVGVRLGTIPVEDVFYGFSMLLSSLFFASLFKKSK